MLCPVCVGVGYNEIIENLKTEISKSRNGVMASSKNYILIRTCKQLGGSDENSRLICHSLAFADQDVCGGGGKGCGAGSPDLPGKLQYWTPPPPL